ncbi:hypothetical protein CA13_19280 [Planctomycetes bacterium CA13]|uniref:Uncharacterized protein n=1 Tax=Novipirellula herctigrandis TaxID=2527986 RepID=A0A5C5YZG9_9BACT|nr:hypothetical protein CA13_19280 [Planctomycetes bacterium CA13]
MKDAPNETLAAATGPGSLSSRERRNWGSGRVKSVKI